MSVVVTSKQVQRVLDAVVDMTGKDDLPMFLSILCLSYVVGCRLNDMSDEDIESSLGRAMLLDADYFQ
jgi:hypothetical protein